MRVELSLFEDNVDKALLEFSNENSTLSFGESIVLFASRSDTSLGKKNIEMKTNFFNFFRKQKNVKTKSIATEQGFTFYKLTSIQGSFGVKSITVREKSMLNVISVPEQSSNQL